MVVVYRHILLVMCCLMTFIPARTLLGQVQSAMGVGAAQTQYTFDVVSVKRSAKEGYSHWRTNADGYLATNVTARQLIIFAYYKTDEPDGFSNIITGDQIRGLPGWAQAEQFDLTAKTDEQTMSRLSRLSNRDRTNTLRKMLQSVLQERFNLGVRREKFDQPVYLLVTSRGGTKLIESSLTPSQSSLSVGNGQIRAKGSKLDELVANLTASVGRFVVDQTRLAGLYDFQLKWHPDDDNDPQNTDPPIFTAIREQLGLTMVASRGLVETVFVVHLDQPTSN